jgi:hypothetical protein
MGFLGLGGDKVTHETQTIGKADKAYVTGVRGAAGQTAAAAQGGQWAQGIDPLTGQAIGQYGDIYGQYGNMYGQGGQMANLGMGALQGGMQTGFGGLGQYVDPIVQAYQQATQGGYDYNLNRARSEGGIAGTLPGQAPDQAGRAGILQAELMGNVMRGRQQELGGVAAQAQNTALQSMMAERARMGQLGLGAYGQGAQGQFGALSGMGSTTRDQALMGDYRRGVGREQAMDEYQRMLAAQQALQSGYMGPMTQTRTTREEGSVFGDLMGMAGIASSFIPGIGGAASGVLGALGGGGGGPQVQAPMVPMGMPQTHGIQVPQLQAPTLQPPPLSF